MIQGGLTATDVFAVEWIQTNKIHYGLTVSYYGFLSDGKSMQCIKFLFVITEGRNFRIKEGNCLL